MTDAGAREAMRLRIIMEAFVATNPGMPISEAVPLIFKTEAKTRDLESMQVIVENGTFELPDTRPQTVAAWIELNPAIGRTARFKKIQAIKDVRTNCNYRGAPLPLKESKDGVEFWLAQDAKRPVGTAPSSSADAEAIADWIDATAHSTASGIIDYLNDGKLIQAIKEVRTLYPGGTGLKEAKDGVQAFEARHGIAPPRWS